MQALRIFAHAAIGSTLPRPRRGVLVTPLHLVPVEDEPADPQPPPPEIAIETPATSTPPGPEELIAGEHILEILASAPQYGETIDAAYRRKERDLAEVFASLARAEASALHRRLCDPRGDDALAQRFSRLVVDRRTRLLAILADAPRREARGRRLGG